MRQFVSAKQKLGTSQEFGNIRMQSQFFRFQEKEQSHQEGISLHYKPPMVIESEILISWNFGSQNGELIPSLFKTRFGFAAQFLNYKWIQNL